MAARHFSFQEKIKPAPPSRACLFLSGSTGGCPFKMTELFRTARFPFFMTCALLCIIDDISFRNEGHNKFVPGLLSSSSSYSNPLCCSIPKYQIPLWNPRNAPRPRIAPVSSFRAFPENNSSTKDSMILFHGFHYFLHYAP